MDKQEEQRRREAAFQAIQNEAEQREAKRRTEEECQQVDEAFGELQEDVIGAIDTLKTWILRLKRYHDECRCEHCGRSVAGREPVCGQCHKQYVTEIELGEDL